MLTEQFLKKESSTFITKQIKIQHTTRVRKDPGFFGLSQTSEIAAVGFDNLVIW